MLKADRARHGGLNACAQEAGLPKRNRRADAARQTGMRARFRGDKGIVKADPAGVVVVVEEGEEARAQGHCLWVSLSSRAPIQETGSPLTALQK